MSSRRTLVAATLLVAAIWGGLAAARRPWAGLTGDEPTYLAMAESLAWDGDLAFGPADRERIESAADPRRRAVILQRTGRGVSYSKPALYPVLAAPFVRVAGRAGLAMVNGIVLAAAAMAVWSAWRRRLSAPRAGWILLAWGGASVVPAYLAWGMSDALQLALAAAGCALALGAQRPVSADGADRGDAAGLLERRWTAAAAGICLGLVAALRYPNAILAAASVAALFAAGRRRRAGVVAAAAATAVAGALLLDLALGGHATPYRAERATFNAATGYPAGEGAAAAMAQFEAGRASHRLAPHPDRDWRVSAYATLYFLAGRHSGALVYFPLFLVLAVAALAGGDAAGRIVAAGALGLAAFYLLWLPENYFGGEAFVGNRYLLPAYGALAVAPRRWPGQRALGAVFLVAALAGASALWSVWSHRGSDSTQNHAHAGLFRRLPYESTAHSLQGRRDRYWSDEFVRFVDPFARVEEHGFLLDSAARPAEILVANGRRDGALRFIVQGEGSEMWVSWRDWRGGDEVRFGPGHDGRARGLLEIQTAPPWRRHPFWWRPGLPGYGRVVRLAVRGPDGARERAELRYLGPYRPAPKFWNRYVHRAELPARAIAGATDWLAVRLRNTGRRAWESRADVPVHLGYRIERVGGGEPRSGPLSPLRGRIERSQETDAAVRLEWPRRPGRYRVDVDLILGGTIWFAEVLGEPVTTGEVEVVAAESAGDAAGRAPGAAAGLAEGSP